MGFLTPLIFFLLNNFYIFIFCQTHFCRYMDYAITVSPFSLLMKQMSSRLLQKHLKLADICCKGLFNQQLASCEQRWGGNVKTTLSSCLPAGEWLRFSLARSLKAFTLPRKSVIFPAFSLTTPASWKIRSLILGFGFLCECSFAWDIYLPQFPHFAH